MSRLRITGLATLLVVSALVGGTIISSVAAATTQRTAAPTADRPASVAEPAVVAPAPDAAEAPGEYCAAFRKAFAANLGVEESALAPAAKQAAIATIDQAVKDGKMKQAVADRLKARIDKADADGCKFLAGRVGKVQAAVGAVKDAVTAAADALHITPAELGAQLKAGKSLKDVATDKGVPYAEVSAAVLKSVKADLDAAVAAGTIKQPRADRILERLTKNLADGRLRNAKPAAPPRLRRGTDPGSVEDDHLPEPLAGSQAIECALDLVEGDPAVDEPLDREPPREMERGVAREVDRRVGEAVVRPEDPAAAVDERVDRERGTRLERGHPDQDRRPAERQAVDRELDRRDAADRLEHEVRPAVGQVAQGGDRAGRVVGGDEAVGRADRAGDRRASPRPGRSRRSARRPRARRPSRTTARPRRAR